MKKAFLFIFLLAQVAASFAQTGRYTIKGNITNLPDSVVIGIYKPVGNLITVSVTDTVVGGKFQLSDTISGPLHKIYLSGFSDNLPSWLADIWVEPGTEINVSGDGVYYPFWNYQSAIPLQASSSALIEATKPLLMEQLTHSKEHQRLMMAISTMDEIPDSVKNRIMFLQDKLHEISNGMSQSRLEYLSTAPIDRVWLEAFAKEVKYHYSDADSLQKASMRKIFERMSPADFTTEEGAMIESYINMAKKVEVGDDMADGVLYDVDGNTHTLSELKSGKYLLLDFWSQGCGPCVQSIPEMKEIEEEYSDRLIIVGINSDEEKMWKEFLAKRQVPGLQWNELAGTKAGLSSRYGVYGIPSYVLIAPDGKILSKWDGYGPGSLKEKLSSLLP